MFNKKKKQQQPYPQQNQPYGQPFGQLQYPQQPQVPDNIVNPQYFMAQDGTVHSGADLAFQPAPVTAPTFLNQQNQPPFPAMNNQDTFGMAQPNQPNAYPVSNGQQNFNQPSMPQQDFNQPYPNDTSNPSAMPPQGFNQPYPNDISNPSAMPQQDVNQAFPVTNETEATVPVQNGMQNALSGQGFWEDDNNGGLGQ